jgi:peptidoglycan/LPS O-acetylase OafA/YrhL
MRNNPQIEIGRLYRPDIDGLRAISILGVLVFHSFPQFSSGGFVGVDVFFVISGFLIGGLIFTEVDEQRFSFRQFYARRIRRIFPALIVVLVATYVVGWFVLFPDEYRQLGKHMVGATAFVSNFVLLNEGGYFDAAAETKPLLHLWSLAIEEQFYVFWPVYVWLAIDKRGLFLKLTFLLCAISFALNVGFLSHSTAFYLPVSRFWELVAGSLLAYAARTHPAALNGKAREYGAWLGFILLLTAIFITPEKNFPGWWALPPVIGTCLLIIAGPTAWFNRNILACRPAVFIGLISYPLYLWHWPLLSYAWIISGNSSAAAGVNSEGPSANIKLILLAATFALSCLTYLCVERPVRFGIRRRMKAVLAAGLMLAIGAVGTLTLLVDGIESRPVAKRNQLLSEDLRIPTATRTSNGSCLRLLGVDVRGEAVCLVNSSTPTVMIFGDSEAMAMHSAIYANIIKAPTVLFAANSHNYQHSACLQAADLAVWMKGQDVCQQLVREALHVIAETPSIKTIVLDFQRDNPFFLEHEKIEQMQAAFLQGGREVVYVLGAPGFWSPIAKCQLRQIAVFGFTVSAGSPRGACRQERWTLEQNQVEERQYIAKLKRDEASVFLYDPLPPFCDEHFCYQAGQEGALFWTANHVNEKGSTRLLNDFFIWARRNLHHFPRE